MFLLAESYFAATRCPFVRAARHFPTERKNTRIRKIHSLVPNEATELNLVALSPIDTSFSIAFLSLLTPCLVSELRKDSSVLYASNLVQSKHKTGRKGETKKDKRRKISSKIHDVTPSFIVQLFPWTGIVGCSVELSRQNGVSNLQNRSKQGKLALFSNRANCLHLRQVQFFV